jgi:hypothetical protein
MTKPREKTTITYVSKDGGGHHAEFDRLFEAALAPLEIYLHRVPGARFSTNAKAPLFYSFFDTKSAETIAALGRAAARSFMGRATIGLFFRPGDCFIAGSFKATVRRTLFRFVSRLPHVHILSILPPEVLPRLREVATDWIYDPQLWDLGYLNEASAEPSRQIVDQLTAVSRGRRFLIALGTQSKGKGFDYLVDIWCASARLREKYIFVVAGRLAAPSAAQAKRFVDHGGVLVNERIANSDLLYLYERADIIWSCYAEEYDQSSGIHGRAVQLGIPVLVRNDSCIDRLGKLLGYPSLGLPGEAAAAAAEQILAWQPGTVDAGRRKETADMMRSRSLSVLVNALYDSDTAS